MKACDSKIKDKICVVCQQSYRPTSYNQKACLGCTDTYRASKKDEWYSRFRELHPNAAKQATDKYGRKHPDKFLYSNVKRRAKKLGIDFTIDLEDVWIPEYCPVLGVKLERNFGHYGGQACSPSLDRINPLKGYTKGNVQVISMKANVMKNNATEDELLKFAEWVNTNYQINR